MRRWIYAYEYVRGDPDRLEERLLEHLGSVLRHAFAPAGQETAVDGSFLVDLPGEVVGLGVAKQARLRTGVAHRSGTRLLVPIEWHAEPATAAFPAFEGQLELEPLSSAHAQVSLVGSYRKPWGPIGAVADAAVLHRVAQRTAEELVRGVTRGLPTSRAPASSPATARRWPLRVRDVMTPDPLTLDPQLPVKSAALLLFHAGVSGAPVVASDGALVGVLSERDLLAKEAPERFGFGRSAAADRRRRAARTVQDACTPSAIVTVPDARLADAAGEMLDHDISRLVVIDQGRVVGIISRHDVLAALVQDDAALYAAVEAALAALAAEDVHVSVSWGVVTLSGTVELRSTHAAAVDAVRSVDGVMNVETDGLRWTNDDVVPLVPLP